MAEEIRIRIIAEDGTEQEIFNGLVDDAKKAGERAGEALEKSLDESAKDGAEKASDSLSRGLRAGDAAVIAAGTAIGNLAAGAILGAIQGIGAGFRAVFGDLGSNIDLAVIQEDSVNALESSLKRIGQFSQETSKDLQDFASSIQSISKFGDEAVLEQLAFAQSLGATAEESKKVVAAAADVSTALGIDLNTATQEIAKTLEGGRSALGRFIPELRGFSEEQLKAGEAVDFLTERFSGAAQDAIQTYGGAVTQLSNTVGDFQESIGRLVTSSGSLRVVINVLSDLFQEFTSGIDGVSQRGDVIRPLIERFLDFADTLNNLIVPTVTQTAQVIGRVFSLAFDTVVTGVNSVVAGVGQLAGAAGQVISIFGENGISRALENFRDSSASVLQESAGSLANDFENLFTFEEGAGTSELVNTFIERTRLGLAEQPPLQIGAELNLGGGGEDGAIGIGGDGETEQQPSPLQAAAEMIGSQAKKICDEQKKVQKCSRETASISQKTAAEISISGQFLANSMTQSLGAVGQALVQGQNPFRAFLGTVLNIIGDLAIQLGSSFIAIGLGVEAIRASVIGLAGGPALAAGLALAILGGALKAFSSRFTGGGGGTGGGPSTPSPSRFTGGDINTPSVSQPNDISRRDSSDINDEDDAPRRNANVEVVIEGSAIGLTGEELGLEIVKVLEEAQFAGVELS